MQELASCGLKQEVVGYIAGPHFNIKPDCTEIVYMTEVDLCHEA